MQKQVSTPFDWMVNQAARLSAPFGTNRSLDLLAATGFLLFVLAMFVVSVTLPGYNYDLVPYLAAALQAAGESDIHRQAWELAKGAMPPGVYNDISAANEYRQAQSGNEQAFLSVLPLYSVKTGYVEFLALFGSAFGYVKTALWSAHFAGLALGLVCLWWMARRGLAQSALVIAPLLLMFNYMDMTSYPSPDIIATALIILALYLWSGEREWVPLPLLFIAYLFRPDTLIFVFAIILSQLAFGRRPWRALLLFGVMMVTSVYIRDASDHPGWWVHYYFSTVTIQNTLVGFAPDFSLMAWAKGMARGVLMSLTEFVWPSVLILLGTALLYCIKAGKAFSEIQKIVLTSCILTVGGKFLVFPLPDDRIYMPYILAAAFILLEVARPQFGWRKDTPTISA